MRYEILLRNIYHDVTIIPYAVVSHVGVDTMLSRVCEANEEERRAFYHRLDMDRRNIFVSPRAPFILAVVVVEKGNIPISLSPSDFFDYESQEDVPAIRALDMEEDSNRALANAYLVSKVQKAEPL